VSSSRFEYDFAASTWTQRDKPVEAGRQMFSEIFSREPTSCMAAAVRAPARSAAGRAGSCRLVSEYTGASNPPRLPAGTPEGRT
jgi:hypothetical protein